MPKVFISYRREDSQYQADRLHAALKPHVADPGRDIFIDVDNIPLGVDFVSHLESKVAQCDVLLALIGPDWLHARDPATGERRLDNPKDFVRVEIASALKREVVVVPVLLDGVAFPPERDLPDDLKPLVRRNGVEVRRLTFDADVQRLIRGLGLKPRTAAVERVRGSGAGIWISLLVVVLLGAAGGGLWFADPLGWRTLTPAAPADVPADDGQTVSSAAPGTAAPDADAFVAPSAGVTQAAGECGEVNALVYFDFDRSDLTPQSVSILEEALTKSFGCVIDRVVIEAHEDIGGSQQYAMGVSERRANAVAQVFVGAGVEGGAIYQQGFGHSRPWQPHVRSPANRRAHVKLELLPPPPPPP